MKQTQPTPPPVITHNGQFAKAIEQYTAANSQFDTSRDYISMSHAHLSVDQIVNQYYQGFEDTIPIRLKCYKGYQMERDLMQRIQAVFGDQISTHIEYTAFDGLVKGHPDLAYSGFPGDCKSVLKDEWLPKDGKLPNRIYWQLQAYMLYGGAYKALVIFESRETGLLYDTWIRENLTIQREINNKFSKAVQRIRS